MSDSAHRDGAVFSGLDAFDDHNVDPDAVDRMLFNFSTTSEIQDWQLDALSPDFNPLAPPPPSIPTTYIETNNTLPSTSTSQQQPSTSNVIPSSSQLNTNQQLQTRQTQTQTQTQNSSVQQQQPNSTLLSAQITNSKQEPQPIAVAVSSQIPITSPTQSNPRKRPNPSTSSPNPIKSPTSSGSSARQRTSTAPCSICSKHISTNGANLRRHEQACRRQRNSGASSARPPSSPSIANPSSVSGQHVREEPFPNSSNTTGSTLLNRRDSDLLNVVRRLETSINTLDVNARLCLRDALVSLSNKAANPQIQPTPEQEAMNRAAEFLVLRMLFLSGQHIMHTPPGTASPYQDPHSLATNQQLSSTNNRDVATHQQPDESDDGTVAASTGVRGASVTQNNPRVSRGVNNNLNTKQEDKPDDGT